MFNLKLCIVIAFSLLKNAVNGTSDITLSMYMYLANHLTPQECLKLTAYLYAEGLELMAVKELEQELPSDEPCSSLLTTWNDSVGKEKNFLNVADSLNKVGNKKLAEWLSDTIFTKLSMDLNDCILQNTTKAVTNITASEVFISSGPNLYIRPEIKTESCSADQTFLFLLLDTVFTYIVLMGIVTLVFYSLDMLINLVKGSENILMFPKIEYKILEIGSIPQDLSIEDKILDPLLS